MTNPVSGGFQFTPTQGLNDTVAYPTTPVNETAARQQVMDFYWQLMNEMNKPSLSAAAYAQYNKLFNGGINVNQRVVSGTVTLSPGQYAHDRWKAGSSGCTYTFSTTNNDTTITISAGSLIQVIEGNGLISGTYTLSWNGTAQGKIGGGAYGSSGTSAIIVGGANLNVEFNVGTINKVRFTPGDQILPFNLRSFGEELALCQRYYEKSYDFDIAPATISTTGAINFLTRVAIPASVANNLYPGQLVFKIPKRISTATVTIYSPNTGASGSVYNGTKAAVRTGVTALGTNDKGIIGLAVSNVSANPIDLDDLIRFHWTVDAEL